MFCDSRTYVNVLLVDDDRDDYLLTKDLFDQIDGTPYRLQWTPDYAAGVEALRNGEHDVCLLDYRLGERSGLELLTQVVADGCTTPIIVLTGRGSGTLEKAALSAGAADYLVKDTLDVDLLWRALRHATERCRALAALRERDRLFRAVFDASVDAMLIADDEARYVDGNPAALKLLGVSRDVLLTKTVADYSPIPSGGLPQAWAEFRRQGTMAGEWTLRSSRGDERLVEFNASANILPNRHISVLRDVTERRRAEIAQSRLAAIVDSAEDAILAADLDAVIGEWNPGAERVFGWTADEAIGMPMTMLMPSERLREAAEIADALSRGNNVRNLETTRQRKDGTSVDISLTICPLRDDSGKIVGSCTIARDITETNRLREQLAIADRMASLGTLAAGVAHEINNPLCAVIVNVDLALQSVLAQCEAAEMGEETADVVEELRDALDAADRVKLIVQDLKLFSRPEERPNTGVNVARVLDSTLRMVANEIRHRAQLVVDYADVPTVDAHEGRLGQVFLNLLVNAAHAIPEGNANSNEIRVVLRVEAACVVVEVRDTGCGIEPAALKRIFEPFVTTKPVGVGTGLGLPICRTIIDSLGGEIAVTSVVGRGSTFRVSLPIGVLGETAESAPSRRPPLVARRARVLLVDDDAMLLRAFTRILAEHHEVTSVTDGREAIRRIKAGESYDLVLCDMMMPDISGMVFHRELAALAPDLARKIVFMTGGAFTAGASSFLDEVPNRRLEKPVEAKNLLHVIDEVAR